MVELAHYSYRELGMTPDGVRHFSPNNGARVQRMEEVTTMISTILLSADYFDDITRERDELSLG